MILTLIVLDSGSHELSSYIADGLRKLTAMTVLVGEYNLIIG